MLCLSEVNLADITEAFKSTKLQGIYRTLDKYIFYVYFEQMLDNIEPPHSRPKHSTSRKHMWL